MVKSLPYEEPCFVLFDYEYTDDERRKHAELLLITWYAKTKRVKNRTPDHCSIKEKVMYSSSKKAFQSKLEGARLIDAFDYSDLEEQTILEHL